MIKKDIFVEIKINKSEVLRIVREDVVGLDYVDDCVEKSFPILRKHIIDNKDIPRDGNKASDKDSELLKDLFLEFLDTLEEVS